MDTAHMVDCVKRYINANDNHDIAVIEELFDMNATVEDPVGSEPHVGLDAIREFYLNGFSSVVKAELTGDIRCAANSAAFPFYVIAKIGDVRMKIEVIDVFEFNEQGRIRSMKAFWGKDNWSTV